MILNCNMNLNVLKMGYQNDRNRTLQNILLVTERGRTKLLIIKLNFNFPIIWDFINFLLFR
jgi:hypothetical protein